MLLALLDEYTDRVDQAAEEIGVFFDYLRQVGVRGLLAEQLNDPGFVHQPEHRSDPGSGVPLEQPRD
jgi:hypothetical protein